MLPQLTIAQRRSLVEKYQLNTSTPAALLIDISHHMAKQPIIDAELARLLALVAAIKEPPDE